MNFHIMTLFPEMVTNGLSTSIIGRAVNRGLLSVEAVNIRDYAFNKHGSVDDYPYGGGAGMLMQAEPVYQCYKALEEKIRSRKGQEETGGERRRGSSTSRPRAGHFPSPWRRNSQRKRILCCSAGIMRGLTSASLRRS